MIHQGAVILNVYWQEGVKFFCGGPFPIGIKCNVPMKVVVDGGDLHLLTHNNH